MSREKPKTSPQKYPISRAVALKYEGADLPQVVATGQSLMAEQIVSRAEAADVPLVEDPALADALASLDIGDHIPENLFRAVAQVLSYALYVSGKHEDVLRRAQQTRNEAQNYRSNNGKKKDEPPE